MEHTTNKIGDVKGSFVSGRRKVHVKRNSHIFSSDREPRPTRNPAARSPLPDVNSGEIRVSDDSTELSVPVASPGRKRVMGLHRGVAWMSEDFDEPLPDEFWLGNDE